MKLDWETIEATKANKNVTTRAKVFGGWLVKHKTITALTNNNESASIGQTASVGICFMPDANHEWQVD